MNMHVQSQWTPATIAKVWRIFDKAVPVIAEGCGVDAEQLRAYLVDGVEPSVAEPETPPVAPKPVAPPAPPEVDPNDTSYLQADNALLARCGRDDRFRLRDEHGEYLHMAVLQNLRTTDKTFAWRGTRSQLRAVREKYPFTRVLKIVVEAGVGTRG